MTDLDVPKGNASHEEWLAYAVTQPLPISLGDMPLAELTRDQLREHFSPAAQASADPSAGVTAAHPADVEGRLPTSEEVSAGYLPPTPPIVADPHLTK